MDFEITKKCKSCGADIPRDASFCDICGAPVTKKAAKETSEKAGDSGAGRKKSTSIFTVIGMGAVLLLAAVVIIAIVSGYIERKQYEIIESRRDLSDWDETVTAEEFEKLDIGMTYEEVKDIIGGDGKLIEDREYGTEYAWPGEYYQDKYHGVLSLYFSKNRYGDDKDEPPKVETISESEIVDGKETSETYKLINEYKASEIDTPVVTKEQAEKIEERMTYEEVCEILGSPGKMYRSSTNIYSTSKYKNTSYVWKTKNNGQDDYMDLSFDNDILAYYSDWKVKYID